jgi:DNA repair protein RadC
MYIMILNYSHKASIPPKGIEAIFILGGKRMSKYQTNNHRHPELLEREVFSKQPAKRVNIVSLKLVRESRELYKECQIKSPEDAYKLFKAISCGSRPGEVCRCLSWREKTADCHVERIN